MVRGEARARRAGRARVDAGWVAEAVEAAVAAARVGPARAAAVGMALVRAGASRAA